MAAERISATSPPCSSPLIPGIPDDVVLYHIFTKVQWKCFFVLPAVNRRWQEEYRSRRVYKLRRSTGTDEQLIAVIHSSASDEIHKSLNSSGFELVVSLFTLSNKDEWLRLPRIPGVPGGVPRGCGLVFLEGILYIIGGVDFEEKGADGCSMRLRWWHCRKTVYELDIAAGRGGWRTGVSMRMEKEDFLCKVEEGRIHMATFSIRCPRWEMDVYDPILQSWTQSFDLSQPSARSFDSVDENTIWDLRMDLPWNRPLQRILFRARVNGSLYSVSADGVFVRNNSSGEWHLHSVSFRDYVRSLGPDDCIQCWNVVPLDGELVVTVSWRRHSLVCSGRRWYTTPSDFIFALVMSRGLSSGEHSVTWNKIQFPDHPGWSGSFPSEGCNERNGSFPVFFDYFQPQVYPCKL